MDLPMVLRAPPTDDSMCFENFPLLPQKAEHWYLVSYKAASCVREGSKGERILIF